MNITKISIISLFVLSLLTGCSKNTPMQQKTVTNKNTINSNIDISNRGKLLGYAYIKKDNSKLLKVTRNLDTSLSDFEIVKIYKNGFYPDYFIPSKFVICLTGKAAEKDYENKVLCNSLFATINKGTTIFANTMMTIGSLGLNLASGATLTHKIFNEDVFINTIEKTNLDQVRKNLLELDQLIANAKNDLKSIYKKELDKYISNLSNISITDKTTNNSGFDVNININSNYSVYSNSPKTKQYFYENILKGKDLAASYLDIKNELLAKIDNDIKEYTKYVNDSFTNANYLIKRSNTSIYKYKDNISLNYHCKAPSKIKYELGKKIAIKADVIIDSLNFYGISPKSFEMSDKNLNVKFEHVNGSLIPGRFSNKSRDYVLVDSVTTYNKGKVYTQSPVNLELAPMVAKKYSVEQNLDFDFKDITKDKAKKIFVEYGHALKYKIINTNIEKTIFNTKKYRLIDLLN